MRVLRVVLVVLAALLLAAHFFRRGAALAAAGSAALPLLLLVPGVWSRRSLQVALALGTVEWLRTLGSLARVRHAVGQPWLRMAIILGCVALVTALGAVLAGRAGKRSTEDA